MKSSNKPKAPRRYPYTIKIAAGKIALFRASCQGTADCANTQALVDLMEGVIKQVDRQLAKRTGDKR